MQVERLHLGRNSRRIPRGREKVELIRESRRSILGSAPGDDDISVPGNETARGEGGGGCLDMFFRILTSSVRGISTRIENLK